MWYKILNLGYVVIHSKKLKWYEYIDLFFIIFKYVSYGIISKVYKNHTFILTITVKDKEYDIDFSYTNTTMDVVLNKESYLVYSIMLLVLFLFLGFYPFVFFVLPDGKYLKNNNLSFIGAVYIKDLINHIKKII